MKYALVIYEQSNLADREEQIAISNASRTAIDKTASGGKVSVLNMCCFLCDLGNGVLDLGHIVGSASAYGIQSRTLFFENVPQFVVSPPRS